jgi:hypothetical protein
MIQLPEEPAFGLDNDEPILLPVGALSPDELAEMVEFPAALIPAAEAADFIEPGEAPEDAIRRHLAFSDSAYVAVGGTSQEMAFLGTRDTYDTSGNPSRMAAWSITTPLFTEEAFHSATQQIADAIREASYRMVEERLTLSVTEGAARGEPR